jgi:folate-binding protein YgfZ
MHYFHFDSATILHVSGKDAARYLNARLTQDFKSMAAGEFRLGAALTPQAKTQALFGINKLSADEAVLIADSGDRATLLQAFRQYLVADRVVVAERSNEQALVHVLGEQRELLDLLQLAELPPANRFLTNAGVTVIHRKRGPESGFDLILPLSDKQMLERAGTALSTDEMRLMRFQIGMPNFPEELNDRALFMESGLRSALAFNRGCYVGQEVVEKVDAIGKLGRQLVALRTDALLPDSTTIDVISEGGESLGKVISIANDQKAHKGYVFAQVRGMNLKAMRDQVKKILLRWDGGQLTAFLIGT